MSPCVVCGRRTRLVVLRHRQRHAYCLDHYAVGLAVEGIRDARQRRSAREAVARRYDSLTEVVQSTHTTPGTLSAAVGA